MQTLIAELENITHKKPFESDGSFQFLIFVLFHSKLPQDTSISKQNKAKKLKAKKKKK